MTQNRQVAKDRRHRRVRKKVRGTAARPRFAVFRSNKHIYAQVIDDVTGVTLAAASTAEKTFTGTGSTVDAAKQVGTLLGERAKGAGVRDGRVRPWRIQLPRPGCRDRRRCPRSRARALSNREGRGLTWPKASTKSE